VSAREFFDRIRAEGWALVSSWPAQQQTEQLYLECKSTNFDPATLKLTNADKDALARALSGFANTDGGVLMFGVNARPAAKGQPDVVQAIEPVRGLPRFAELVRDTAKTIVEPAIAGIDLELVTAPGVADEGVLALLVPRSMGGPHRANGGEEKTKDRYFMRTADSTIVMPHRQLAAIFAAPPEPRLGLLLVYPSEGGPISVHIHNSGPGSAQHVRLQLFLRDWSGRTLGKWASMDPHWEPSGVTSFILHAGRPLYPEEVFRVGELRFKLDELSMPSFVAIDGRVDSLSSRPLFLERRRISSGQALRVTHDGVEEGFARDVVL